MSWSMPWLLLIALQPFIILAFRTYLESKQLKNYASKSLLPWVLIPKNKSLKNNIFIRNISYVLAWVLFAVAAAGPRIAEELPVGSGQTGQEIIIVLDISQSMQATDLEPNRLKQANLRIKKIIDAMNQSRIGIIVYAAKPHLYVPLTYDKSALNFYIKNINILVPPSQGSKPLDALKLANDILSTKSKKGDGSAKSIILITDTDTSDKENAKFKALTKNLSQSNIPVYTLSMASAQGEAIPAFKDGWINKNGLPIISRPNIAYYQSLSTRTNGILERYNIDGAGITSIIKEIKSLGRKSTLESNFTQWDELFYWFLIPGIFFLFISMASYRLKPIKSSLINPLLLLLFTATLSFTNSELQANEDTTLREAHQALLKHDYVKSRELYSSVNSYHARYGEAVSAYRLNDYPRAIRLFEQSVLLATLDTEFSKSLYNLGNSYFQVGNYRYAIQSFEGALLYMPNNEKVKQNMLFSKRALQAVKDRAKVLTLTSRAGRGPRTARANDNIEINENNNISLDSSESLKINNESSPETYDQAIPELIILKGLEFAQGSSSNNGDKYRNTPLEVSSATSARHLSNLHDNQAFLWKRIFEIEENYPAPLNEPETIPGVSPW